MSKFGDHSRQQLTNTDIANDDHFLVNDKSDTNSSPEGKVKRFTVSHLKGLILGLFSGTGLISYNQSTGAIGLNNLTTSNIPEGSNLYFTESRFDTQFNTKSTDHVDDGHYSSKIYKVSKKLGSTAMNSLGVDHVEVLKDLPDDVLIDIISCHAYYRFEGAPYDSSGGMIQLYWGSNSVVHVEFDIPLYTTTNDAAQLGIFTNNLYKLGLGGEKLLVKLENNVNPAPTGAKGTVELHLAYRIVPVIQW